MRIIDADALFRQVSRNLGTATMYLPIDFQEEIMEAPTIDAIPVEWLEAHKTEYLDDWGKEPVSVEAALRIWQKEQEAQDGKA